MGKFFASVREEMRLVTWPTGKRLKKDVITVIETTIFFAVFFAVVDFAIESLVKLFM